MPTQGTPAAGSGRRRIDRVRELVREDRIPWVRRMDAGTSLLCGGFVPSQQRRCRRTAGWELVLNTDDPTGDQGLLLTVVYCQAHLLSKLVRDTQYDRIVQKFGQSDPRPVRRRASATGHLSSTECRHEGCDRSFPSHRHGTMRAQSAGWFMQRNGDCWCPQHVPSWVAGWREAKEAKSRRYGAFE